MIPNQETTENYFQFFFKTYFCLIPLFLTEFWSLRNRLLIN